MVVRRAARGAEPESLTVDSEFVRMDEVGVSIEWPGGVEEFVPWANVVVVRTDPE